MVWGPIQVFPMLFIFEKFYPVSPSMCWKGTRITEAFPKFCNFIWFLSSGHCRMSSKSCVTNEGFPTCLTVTGFLSSEFSFMSSKIWYHVKALPHSLHAQGFSPVWVLSRLGTQNCTFYHVAYVHKVSHLWESSNTLGFTTLHIT